MITRSGPPTCPRWCIALHFDDDDTLHYGASREVSVVARAPTASPVSATDPGGTARHADAVETLFLVQHQEGHDQLPWLTLLLRDGPLLDITVDSARRLGASLLESGEG